jgi:hypothetical protein
MKPIQEILISKVKTLVEKQRLADAIEDSSTKGNLRESFLKDFIVDIIPREYELTSGFVTSHNQDKLSPQIDLIVTDKSKTPKFILDKDNSIVPFESALLLIEIKTTLTEKVVEQLNKQRDYINNCGKPVYYRDYILNDLKNIEDKTCIKMQVNSNQFDKPLIWLVGFKSDLSEKRLKELVLKVEGMTGIWLVGQYSLYAENGQIKKIESDKSTLFTIERILTIITVMQQQRNYYHMNWTKYL